MFLTIIVVLISLIVFVDYSKKKRKNELTANIPGPFTVPLLGSPLIFQQRDMKDSIRIIQRLCKTYGKILRAWIFTRQVFIISGPEYLEEIMSSPKHISKGYLYTFLTQWLGTGLLISTGPKWHSRRKIITPTFHFKILEEFVEIFDQQSAVLVGKLQRHLDGKEFNIYPYITLQALDVVSETAMGTKINAQTNPDNEYVRAVADITTILTQRFLNIWYRSDLIFSVIAPNIKKRHDDVIKVLHNFTETIIEERRNLLVSKMKEQTEEKLEDDVGTKKKSALLDVLLQSTVDGKPLTNADIREEVDTFMFEGHDTTTSAICFTLYSISRHPDIQEKLFREIRQVIGDDKARPVSPRDLQDLKYLECTIKEGLRMYPSVPVIARSISEDLHLKEYMIPAGSNVTIPIYVMLKDSEIFPEPEKFIPERHSLENSMEKTNPYSYIPFSAGPRNCIGQKFAMLEIKSTISKILRHYELLPLGSEPELAIHLVLRSLNGINIGIKERQY